MLEVTVRVIENEEDYQAVLDRIDELFDAPKGSPEAHELGVLLLLADNYQKKTKVFPKVEPVEVIKFMMEQQGLKQVDLAPYMGGRNRVSEVLSGKRQLTLDMIRNLSAGLHIPLEALI